MSRSLARAVMLAVALAAPVVLAASAAPRAPRSADPDAAIELFYEALTRDPARHDHALDALRRAAAAHPLHERLPLALGMAHLRAASESAADDPAAPEHLALAAHHLGVAARRMPDDARIPGWRDGAAWFLARREGREDDAARALDRLRASFGGDPCFHGVPLGIALYDAPRGSAAFTEGLEAMRRPMACTEGDPSGVNGPLWPHNVQGYLLGLADYEIKAGERTRAETALMALEASEGYGRWPYRHLAEQRLDELAERIAAHESGDGPPLVIGRGSRASCSACHLGGR